MDRNMDNTQKPLQDKITPHRVLGTFVPKTGSGASSRRWPNSTGELLAKFQQHFESDPDIAATHPSRSG